MNISSFRLRESVTFLLFLSLFFNTTSNVYLFYLAFLSAFALLLIDWMFLGKVRISRFAFAYVFLIIWGVASYYWARDIRFVSSMIPRMLISFLCLLYCFNNSRTFTTPAMYGMICGVILNVPLIPFESFYVIGRFAGSTSNPNHISLLTSFTLLVTFANKNVISKSLFLVVLACSLSIIVSTGSRKFLVLLIIVVFLYFSNTHRKNVLSSASLFFIVFSATLIMIGVLNIEYLAQHITFLERFYELSNSDFSDLSQQGFGGDSSTRFRLLFIVWAFDLFKEYPLTGIGLDNFKTVYGEDFYSHNNYVELLSTLGLVGFFAYYYFFIKMVGPLIKTGKLFNVFVGFYLIGMDFAMVTYFERMYLLPMYLIFVSCIRERNESSTHY